MAGLEILNASLNQLSLDFAQVQRSIANFQQALLSLSQPSPPSSPPSAELDQKLFESVLDHGGHEDHEQDDDDEGDSSSSQGDASERTLSAAASEAGLEIQGEEPPFSPGPAHESGNPVASQVEDENEAEDTLGSLVSSISKLNVTLPPRGSASSPASVATTPRLSARVPEGGSSALEAFAEPSRGPEQTELSEREREPTQHQEPSSVPNNNNVVPNSSVVPSSSVPSARPRGHERHNTSPELARKLSPPPAYESSEEDEDEERRGERALRRGFPGSNNGRKQPQADPAAASLSSLNSSLNSSLSSGGASAEAGARKAWVVPAAVAVGAEETEEEELKAREPSSVLAAHVRSLESSDEEEEEEEAAGQGLSGASFAQRLGYSLNEELPRAPRRQASNSTSEGELRAEDEDEAKESFAAPQVQTRLRARSIRRRRRQEQQALLQRPGPQKFEDNIYLGSANSIILNVGGRRFRTTRSTLFLRQSMLQGLLSGHFGAASVVPKRPSHLQHLQQQQQQQQPQLETEYFIDRDPRLFHHILNYLRDGAVFLDELDRQEKSALLREARFYAVTNLVHVLEVDHRRRINAEHRELSQEKEYKLVTNVPASALRSVMCFFTIHEGYNFESWTYAGPSVCGSCLSGGGSHLGSPSSSGLLGRRRNSSNIGPGAFGLNSPNGGGAGAGLGNGGPGNPAGAAGPPFPAGNPGEPGGAQAAAPEPGEQGGGGGIFASDYQNAVRGAGLRVMGVRGPDAQAQQGLLEYLRSQGREATALEVGLGHDGLGGLGGLDAASMDQAVGRVSILFSKGITKGELRLLDRLNNST